MDAPEINAWRLGAKEELTPRNGKYFIFPIADGTVKLSGGDQVLRTPTFIRDNPERGEERGNLLEESDGSPPPQDSLPGDGEARTDFWSISTNYIHRHHVEPRVKLYYPFPLKYIDVFRNTHTNLDVLQESRIDDNWNIDGSRDLCDSWTGFTRFEKKPPDGYMWSGRRLTRRQLTSRPDHSWPELWTKLAGNAKLKEKQKWSNEKAPSW